MIKFDNVFAQRQQQTLLLRVRRIQLAASLGMAKHCWATNWRSHSHSFWLQILAMQFDLIIPARKATGSCCCTDDLQRENSKAILREGDWLFLSPGEMATGSSSNDMPPALSAPPSNQGATADNCMCQCN